VQEHPWESPRDSAIEGIRIQGIRDVGECAQEPRQQLLPRTNPAEWLRDPGDVDDAVRREHCVRRGHVPTIQALDPDALVLHHRLDRNARPPRRGERESRGRLRPLAPPPPDAGGLAYP